MATTVMLRLWMPDRPGSLAQVTMAIARANGDVVGIDILEREGGRAIDEIVVSIPEGDTDKLVAAVVAIDGVAVEDVRPVIGEGGDARAAALQTAAALVEERDGSKLLATLADEVHTDFVANWTAVVELEGPELLAEVGDAPPVAWLTAFVYGSRSSEGQGGPDDVAWAELPETGLALVVGRDGRPFRSRERLQLSALARIADARRRELGI